MANNCLVTKLKSEVNNDSLVKLGEWTVSMHSGGQIRIKGNARVYAYDGKTFTYKDYQGYTHLNSSDVTISNSTNYSIIYPTTDTIIGVVDKYHLSAFEVEQATMIDPSNMQFVDSYTVLQFDYCTFPNKVNLTDYNNNNLTEVRISNSPFIGDIMDLKDNIELSVIALGSQSEVTGELLDFLKYQILNKNRTSGTIALPYSPVLTFNDSHIPGTGNAKVTWEPISSNYKISLKQGDTEVSYVIIDSNGDIVN